MFKKITLFSFALLLAMQLAACLPRPSSSEEDNTIPHGISTTMLTVAESGMSGGRKRLEAVLFKEYINLLNSCLQRSIQIAKDVLADPSMTNIESSAMEYERNILAKYVTDSKEALTAILPADKNDQNNRFYFAMGKNFVLENFNGFNRRRASATDELTPEKKVSWETLKKHGALEYTEEMEKRSKDFGCHIVDEFDKYMKSLSVSEKEKEKEMVEVWDKYSKNELNMDKAEFGEKLFLQLFQYES